MIDILLPAFLISFILLGIHSYFGMQIIKRGIIFTDLSIGQMAALGAAVSLVLFDGTAQYWFSLGFAVIGGLIIAYFSTHLKNQETVIGLLYAFGISAVFVLLSKSPHGMETFQNLMAYDILFTSSSEICSTALIYGGIGSILIILNSRLSPKGKNLLFFLSFALTVTSSVKIAGVLVVFAILLAPAYISLQIVQKIKRMPLLLKKYPLILAWIIGICMNLVSMIISYHLDFPTGYTIVLLNSFLAITSAFIFKA